MAATDFEADDCALPMEVLLRIVVNLPLQDVKTWRRICKFWNQALKLKEFQTLWLKEDHFFVDIGPGLIVEWCPRSPLGTLPPVPRCAGALWLVASDNALTCLLRGPPGSRRSLFRKGRKLLGLSSSKCLLLSFDGILFLVWDALTDQTWKVKLLNLPLILPVHTQHTQDFLFEGKPARVYIGRYKDGFRVALFSLMTDGVGAGQGALWESDTQVSSMNNETRKARKLKKQKRCDIWL